MAQARIQAQKDDITRLIAHNQELANAPVPERSVTPLFMSESEEDIKALKDAGTIGIREAEQLLRELQFDNEEILVDDTSMSLYR